MAWYNIQVRGCGGMADAPDLGSGVSDVQVQVLSPAPKQKGAERLLLIIAQINKPTMNLAYLRSKYAKVVDWEEA